MRPVVIVGLGLLAAACTRLPVVDSDGLDAEARRARIAEVTHWQMNGRLAVDTGERSFLARFRWRQSDDQLTLTVSGPLSAGGFQIDGTTERLTILRRRERLVLDDPEADLSAMYGWWLPVTSLEHWLLGQPDARFPARSRSGSAGELTRLSQRLWELDYPEHQLAAGIMIPRTVHMVHEPLVLELTIDRWEPLAAAGDPLN